VAGSLRAVAGTSENHEETLPMLIGNALNQAAARLVVKPNTLRSLGAGGRRFGYPQPRRYACGHRQFELVHIEALRQAFA